MSSIYLEIQVFPMMLDPNPHAGEGDCCIIEEVGQAQYYDGHVMQRDSSTHEMLDTVEEVINLSRIQITKWWDEVQEAYPDAPQSGTWMHLWMMLPSPYWQYWHASSSSSE